MTYGDAKSNLSAMIHGGSLNKVRDVEMMFERAANTLLAKIDPVETERVAPISNVVHDDVYNYALPSDYKKIIDLYPQDNRTSQDTAARRPSQIFDLNKALVNKTLSIQGSEGSKIIKINWRSRQGKTLNTLNSLTANGTWEAVGTASNVVLDTITKVSGSGSIRFDLAASGDGIQNDDMTAVDLSDEDEVGDVFVWAYFSSVSALTSLTAFWGNDLDTNYWTSTASTTQADGTAFKAGWNLIKFSWSAATETGTVAPATIDSFKLTVAATGAISNIRVDNIIFSIGRNFDLDYYSKYVFKNEAGTWISRPTTDLDEVVLDNDAIQIYLLECLIAAAQQMEGEDSGFDLNWANRELNGDPSALDPVKRAGLYRTYRKEHPSRSKAQTGYYGNSPARGRW